MILRKWLFRALGLGINLFAIPAPRRAGKWALEIFGNPPKPRVQPKEARFLDTARREDFAFEGKRIATFVWDPKSGLQSSHSRSKSAIPYVLLAYGWGYNSGRWRYYVNPLLEAGYRVVAFDPPGHGYSDRDFLEYPTTVRLQREIIDRYGRPELMLGHSFGGGCFVGTLAELPPALHPRRICLMGTFSDARFIFHNYRNALGLSRRSYLEMTRAIVARTGRRLSSFDNAVQAAGLDRIECLLVHDPEDEVTAFSNALRNHEYWRGSALYRALGAGHHLGTATVTRVVMDWLIDGQLPAEVSISPGLPDADHELRTFFRSVEQDLAHGRMESSYFG